MIEPAPHHPDAALERQVAARIAELTELLGYLSACWDDERRQLARQLHDNLGSSMTALTMHLGLLTQHIPAENMAMRERSAQMKRLLGNIIDTNRKIQLALWNDKLEFLGLKTALGELAADYGREHAVAVRVSLPDEETAYLRVQDLALLRCAEAGLRNVAKHAQASEIDMVLDDDGEQIMLTVRDNGVGPGADAMQSRNGHSLRLLRERARFLGGMLTLTAGAQGGAVLTMTLPKEPAAAA